MGKRKRATPDTGTYRAKRDFTRTPEPPAGEPAPRDGRPVFVVHRHDARRLHYDLRLEMDGVLKSFAIPKGFSYSPSDKRLAVRTEDHPLEYEHFSGVIPKGQYGAGTMTIWDRGWFTVLGDRNGPDALAAGKLELRFDGARLRGEWHMVKLKNDPRGWLLFKGRDLYARGKDEPVFGIPLADVPRRPLPQRIRPMRAGARSEPFRDPDWLFELQFAGERVLAEKRLDQIRFRGTRRRGLAARLPQVVAGLRKLRAEQALVDGVLVCLDDARRPSPALLDARLRGEQDGPIDYYLFDLLYYDAWDLRRTPLLERKAGLASLMVEDAAVLYLDHERSRGTELIETVAAVGLPGVIAKHVASAYTSGPSPDWREVPVPAAAGSGHTRDLFAALRDATRRRKGGRRAPVRQTNRHRVLWPADGYTKGDLIDYYDQVADTLLPYLRDRPLSLKRYPSGIERESFFQKHVPGHRPDWISTAVVDSHSTRGKQVEFILCNDRPTLLYLANLASIELHPWSSRVGSLETPDWAIFDLDPEQVSFRVVVRVARAIGKLLQSIGLHSYLKTSGSKGLHIYVPLQPAYQYEQTRMFCEGIARWIVHEHPRSATLERAKSRRRGKVYIDFLQNRRGQTIVAPYSVRPRPGAPVSTPLDWDELQSDLDPDQFSMQTVIHRLAARRDPFAGALREPQDLLPALEAITADPP